MGIKIININNETCVYCDIINDNHHCQTQPRQFLHWPAHYSMCQLINSAMNPVTRVEVHTRMPCQIRTRDIEWFPTETTDLWHRIKMRMEMRNKSMDNKPTKEQKDCNCRHKDMELWCDYQWENSPPDTKWERCSQL